jgi:hypothetical protein
MVYNFISLCISVLSVPSAVKQKGRDAVKTFNHREHGDTRRIFYLVFIPE